LKPDGLAELRDIHLPEPVSWWPPAPGWWILLTLCCLLVLTGTFVWRRQKARRNKPAQKIVVAAALAELDELDRALQGGEKKALEQLSSLMRRMAIKMDVKTAGLAGEQWLQWLDSRWSGDEFVSGSGQVLIEAPYQAQRRADAVQLGRVCRQWLEAQR